MAIAAFTIGNGYSGLAVYVPVFRGIGTTAASVTTIGVLFAGSPA